MWWVRARAAVAPASDLRPQARPGSSPSKLCDLRFVLRLEQVSCSGLDVATGSAMSGFLMFMAAPRAEQAAEFPLDGLLEIDENYYGGRSKPESRGCGHTDPNKSLMAIAIETIPALAHQGEGIKKKSRFVRRYPADPENNGGRSTAGHRHGHRSRSLLGTFGRVEVAVPRARLDTAEGKTTEWKSTRCRLTSGAPSRPIR
jgi:hypothetical protein